MDEYRVRIDRSGVIRLPAETKMRLGPSLDSVYSVYVESRKFIVAPVEEEVDEDLIKILVHEGILIG